MRIRYSDFVVFHLVLVVGCSNSKPSSEQLHYITSYDSIGVNMGDEMYIFGAITSVCTFPDQTIGVLDAAMRTVRFYTPDGEYIRKFTPLGSGPGEFSQLGQLGCDEFGNIMITSSIDRKMAWYAPDFTFLSEIVFASTHRGGPTRTCSSPNSGFVTITTLMQPPDSVGMEISLFKESDEPDVVYRRRMTILEDHSGNFQNETNMVFTTDSDGRVYIADRSIDTFHITCFSADGDSLFCINQPYERVRRTQEEIDRLTEAARQNWIAITGSSVGFSYEPLEYFYSIRSIDVDGTGRIWVRSSPDPNVYQVFDSSGEYLYECSIIMPDWQEVSGWNININAYGILAVTSNPEHFPIVYIMKEATEARTYM